VLVAPCRARGSRLAPGDAETGAVAVTKLGGLSGHRLAEELREGYAAPPCLGLEHG
jgi:hypothetical protein